MFRMQVLHMGDLRRFNKMISTVFIIGSYYLTHWVIDQILCRHLPHIILVQTEHKPDVK